MLYHNAIVRTPGSNFSEGLTTSGLGPPEYRRALGQHAAYIDALRAAGLDVKILPPDPAHPDGCFVEDMAVVTPEMAVIANSGAASRRGEKDAIAACLKPFRRLLFIESPGTLDGGDILRVERKFYVGVSERTNEEGAAQFDRIVSEFGYSTVLVPLGAMLHLKSGVAYIGQNRIIAVPELAAGKLFSSFEIIETAPGEEYAANCLRVDESTLIIARGHPSLRGSLGRLGYTIAELGMSEFRKMDGGLTCLSLLF